MAGQVFHKLFSNRVPKLWFSCTILFQAPSDQRQNYVGPKITLVPAQILDFLRNSPTRLGAVGEEKNKLVSSPAAELRHRSARQTLDPENIQTQPLLLLLSIALAQIDQILRENVILRFFCAQIEANTQVLSGRLADPPLVSWGWRGPMWIPPMRMFLQVIPLIEGILHNERD